MKRTLSIAALAGAVALAGCVTHDPYTGEAVPSHAGHDAVAGGVIGATIGAIVSRHPGRGALLGAGIGALAGAAVGTYQDQQEADLRHAMREHMQRDGVMIERRGNEVILSLRNDLLFDTGSAELSPRADRALRAAARVLRRHRQNYVYVNGYTDTVGDPQANLQLSQQRADAVADALEQYGVEDSRIETKGYGEQHLRVPTPNNTPEPRNRRVEIVLEPYTG